MKNPFSHIINAKTLTAITAGAVIVTALTVANITGSVANTQVKATNNTLCPNGEVLTPNQFLAAYQTADALTISPFTKDIANKKASVTITNNTGCVVPMSYSIWKVMNPHGSANFLSTQQLFDSTNLILVGPGSHTYTLNLPSCQVQLDTWYGMHPTSLLDSDPYHDVHGQYWVITGDLTWDQPVCEQPTPTPTPTATPTPSATPTPTPATNNNDNKNNNNNCTGQNACSATSNPTINITTNQPQVVSQATTPVKSLPKTGLPLAGLALAGLLPAGLKLRKNGQSVDQADSANSVWEQRQLKK